MSYAKNSNSYGWDEGIVTLSREALEASKMADNAMKYFSMLIEAKRTQYNLLNNQYAYMLGLSSADYYAQCFQSKKHPYGMAPASALLRFCYLFGYDLALPDEYAAMANPQTRRDLDAFELASLLLVLPKPVLIELRDAINQSDKFENETLKRRCAKALTRFIQNDNSDTDIVWSNRLFASKGSTNWLKKTSKIKPEEVKEAEDSPK